MLLLVLANLAAHTHTLGKEFHQAVVEFVNLLTQFVNTLSGDSLRTHYEQSENVVKHIGSNLLLGVAPCVVGRAMALYHKSVKAKVHCLLAERSNQFASTANMARVADDRQVGNAAAQLDWNLPHRQVAVNLLVEA